jgi:hypothetical protein
MPGPSKSPGWSPSPDFFLSVFVGFAIHAPRLIGGESSHGAPAGRNENVYP